MEHEFQAPDDPTPAALPTHGTAAVDRGADLLVRVLESERPIALNELATAAGIPKSTASRLVTALERRGLVEQEGTRGRLRPGPAILRAAERGMFERNVIELAAPYLDALSDACGETINLALPAPLGVEHVAQVDSRHFLGVGQWLGRSVDFHSTANGKVFLAYGRALMPAEPLALHTSHTVSSPAALARELEVVRRHGFATAVDELEVGLAAMAAPVWGARGNVVAALSVSGPTVRMTPDRIRELRPVLIDQAIRLSSRLGHREKGEHAA